MTRTKTANGRSTAMTGAYFELVRQHPLTSIRTDLELNRAQTIVDQLLKQDLDGGGLAYLDALSDLILVYEQEHHSIHRLPPHELLGQMLHERSMSQADLVRLTGIAKATISDLVSGRRGFTIAQMQTIAGAFGLPGAVFMPES